MKNEELNLAELLKDCPKGIKFYTPICGVVEFVAIGGIYAPNYPIKTSNNIDDYYFTKEGYFHMNGTPECLLFPSKDQRDWNVWKENQDKKNKNPFKVGDYVIDNRNCTISIITNVIDKDNVEVRLIDVNISTHLTIAYLTKIGKYPISHFKPFDRVLVRYESHKWAADLFSDYNELSRCPYRCVGIVGSQCIPYNSETKHLLGTTEKAPEFYINWEEE